MRELRAIALSEDGGYLVLADAAGRTDGEQFRVPVDDRLRAALRGVRRSEVRTESALTPREIQARLRAGETAAEVARAAGIPVERVERYEGPVLAERARVVQEARAALLPKDPGGVPGRPLGEVVDARLVVAQDNPAAAQWDAWRRVDGIWLVQLTSESRCARWTWDPVVRRVRPHDDAARALVAPESAEPAAPTAPTAAPRAAGPALTLVPDQAPPATAPAARPPVTAAPPPAFPQEPAARSYPQPAVFPAAPAAAYPPADGPAVPQRPAAALRPQGPAQDGRWQPAPREPWDPSGRPGAFRAVLEPALEPEPGRAPEPGAAPAASQPPPAAAVPLRAEPAAAAAAGLSQAGVGSVVFGTPAAPAPAAASPGPARADDGGVPAVSAPEVQAAAETHPNAAADASSAHDAARAATTEQPGPDAGFAGTDTDGYADTDSYADAGGETDNDGYAEQAEPREVAQADRRPEPQPPRRTAATRVSALPRNAGRRVGSEAGGSRSVPTAAPGRGGAASRPAASAPAASAAPTHQGETPRAAVAQAGPSRVTSATSPSGIAAVPTASSPPDRSGRASGATASRPTGRAAAAAAARAAGGSTAAAAPPAAVAATTEPGDQTTDSAVQAPAGAPAAAGGRRATPAAATTKSKTPSTPVAEKSTDSDDEAASEQSNAPAASRGRQNTGTRGGERPAGGRRGRKSVPAWDDIVFGARRT